MKKGMFPIIIAIVFLLVGSVVGACIGIQADQLSGILGTVSTAVVSFVQKHIGFAVSGHVGGLIPVVVLLYAWGVLSLVCRKRPFFWWMIPVSGVMFYTVYLFAMMLQQSPEPAWILDALYARSARGGSGLLLLAFLLETLVGILLLMLSMALNARWRKKDVLAVASRKRKEEQEAKLSTLAEDYSLSVPVEQSSEGAEPLKTKKGKKRKERKADADASLAKETSEETLVTFELDSDGNQIDNGVVHPVKPIDPDAPLVFPEIIDGPKLKRISRKKSVDGNSSGPTPVSGFENPVAPVEEPDAVQASENDGAPVSGFLQAALSAVGQTNAESQPVASSKVFKAGQLVAAVAQAQGTPVAASGASRSRPKIQSSLAEAQERAQLEAQKVRGGSQTGISGTAGGFSMKAAETTPSVSQVPEPEPMKLRHKLFGIPSLKKKNESDSIEGASVSPVSLDEPRGADEPVQAAGMADDTPTVPSMSPELQALRERLASQPKAVPAAPVVAPAAPVTLSVPVTPSTPSAHSAPVDSPKQGISSFAPHSTARPVNGGVSEDAPVPPPAPEPKNPDDDMDVLSGVGGLSSSSAGKSALLNRKRLVYQFPPADLLLTYPDHSNDVDEETIHNGELLIETLRQFKIQATLMNIVKGPTVTMFEVSPAPGVRVNTIVNLADNIALSLAAQRVRIVAPIPGKQAVGIEVPNKKRQIIGFKEMIPSMDAKEYAIPMVLGRTITGEPIVTDLASTPHLLIAGSTGSGKSVCVNSLICSILYRKSPKEVRLIMVDPKIVELKIYNGIPHLLTPVITEAKKTIKALEFCIYEMDRRYKLLQGLNVRNIKAYNKKIVEARLAREKLPYIAVIIDEFADLMATVGKELETQLARLAAMSRAIGIHLVLATQRPSVNVITGLIKSNIPSRIAFAVTSAMDSRIIIDEIGAEKLLGKGDMLYSSNADPSPSRIQGAFLSDEEVEKVVGFACSQGEPDYIDEAFFEDDEPEDSGDVGDDDFGDGDDALMDKALRIVVERNGASASYLQRRLKIGYNRAARLVEQMEELGYVGPPNGSKPRELLKFPD